MWKVTKAQRARRNRYREEGLCIDCAKPTSFGKTRCQYCLELDSKRVQRYKRRHPARRKEINQKTVAKRIKQGLCRSCGKGPLDASRGDSERQCVNCNQGLYSEGYIPHAAKGF